MTSIERTAYPRFKRLITARELHLFFSPGLEEALWAAERTESDEHQLALLLMLKSYQRMGCFPKLGEVPDMVVDFARRALNLPEGTRAAHASGRSAEQHRALVRQRVGVRYDAARARELARETIRAEAGSKNNPADLINVALEKLVEAGLELPAYSTLDHMASTVRAEVNTAICAGIWERTSEAERSGLLSLLDVEDLGPGGKSLFNRLKQPAQRATWSHFRNQKNHLEWVDGLGDTGAWLAGVAPGKVTDFAGEAAAADAGVLRDYALAKRVALIACLAHKARMRARDDLATMFCKRVAIKVKKARDELEEIRRHQQAIVEVLVGNYRTLLQKVDAGGPAQEARARAAELTGDALRSLEDLDEADTAGDVARLLGGTRKVSPALLALIRALRAQSGGIGAVTAAVDAFGGFAEQYAQIEKVSAHHGDNWEVLLHEQLQRDRAVMFELSDKLELTATSEDSRVLDALAHARRHKSSREYIPAFDDTGNPVDISFATQNWQRNVRDRDRPGSFVRRHFEAMVFCNLADELRTGDVAVAGSEEYADWSEQLLPLGPGGGDAARLPGRGGPARGGRRAALRRGCVPGPAGGPAHRGGGRGRLGVPGQRGPVHRPRHRGAYLEPAQGRGDAGLGQAAGAGDPLADAGAPAAGDRGADRALDRVVAPLRADVRQRAQAQGSLRPVRHHYLCRRHQHGPYEAARHIPGVSGHELSATANRHFSIAKLNEAITDLVNAHARLDLSRAWGDGTTAAADGTHMDTYLNNLLAETSIRHGKPGGIAYHHIADTYIALFTHFIPCGVWEAVYIIEGLLKNTSEIQPSTIHADTQGQSLPVFSLAHLLGFELMPRIRNWKELNFYRPSKGTAYMHIDALFGEPGSNVIDWEIIEAHFKDLMRVAISVREGRLSSTLLLRRLRSGSRRNAHYTAFREVGRVVRTVQLLKYLTDPAMRRRVTAATNKVEAYNGFSEWVRFGNRGVLADNDPVEQEKALKFNSLLTNVLIFHNTLDIADVVRELQAEGWIIEPEDLAQVSPYLTEHIMRFGQYSTHELGLEPDAYEPHLDVDFTKLEPDEPDGQQQEAA